MSRFLKSKQKCGRQFSGNSQVVEIRTAKGCVVFQIIFRGKAENPGVTYQYTISKREPKTVQYSWILNDWTQCSATCGGGTQIRRPLCQESVSVSVPTLIDGTATIVDESWCDAAVRPEQLMRACNVEACPSHWWIGPWQSCPVSCAAKVSPFRKSLLFAKLFPTYVYI